MSALLCAAALALSLPAHPLLGGDGEFAALGRGLQQQSGAPQPAPAPPSQPAPSLDFDLLGDQGNQAIDPRAVELQAKMQRRRALLTAHQISGFALAGLMAGTMITGQLNYSDRFAGASTGRYKAVHTGFAVSTEIVFAATGALAILAPVPVAPPLDAGISRADIHRFSMLGATVGMFTEAGLGFWTASREGYADQSKLAAVHLAVGYTTLALMVTAVSALVF